MNVPATGFVKTRTARFHSYGEPSQVLRLEETQIPGPAAQRERVKVNACGLHPADWALCRGLFAGSLPRGIGVEVSGKVHAVGEGVSDAVPGNAVFGPVDFVSTASAGASDFAILQHWTRIPARLDPIQAAALPMAVAIAYGSLDCLGAAAGHTVLIHGAGTPAGFAAAQIALLRGCRVVATAGAIFAEQLRRLGASVTSYGEGMVERVLGIIGQRPDIVLDTAPVTGALGALVTIGGGSKRVMTISDLAAAK